jgi:hypothetical protein
MEFKKLNPQHLYGSSKDDMKAFEKQLAQHDQAFAAKVKETGEKMMAKLQEKMAQQIVESMGVPPAVFGGSANISTTVTKPWGSIDYFAREVARAEARARRILEERAIWERLPRWITQNTVPLARSLWVAEKVFENNLAAVAIQHRMRIWK